jgi:hypothetical protein
VDDGLGLALEDGLADGGRVKQIELHRLGAERPYAVGVSGRVEGADHLVPSIDQLGDKPGADSTACPGDENSHCLVLSGSEFITR